MTEFIRKLMVHNNIRITETLHLTCPIHGEYTNNRIEHTLLDGSVEELPLSGCSQCREEEARKQMEESYETSLLQGKMASSQIPLKLQDCMVRTFQTGGDAKKVHARDIVIAFIKGEVRSLVLLGGTGRGKSHLIASALKGCITTGKSALYVAEREIYRDIHDTYGQSGSHEREKAVVERYSSIPVLGIDEIGRASGTEHEAQILYEIIDKRDSRNLKTIIAGNLLPEEFDGRFDDSFKRKLGATVIVCTWPRWEE